MKQTIVALVRPNLNLGQKESQVAHIIEHLLLAPKRLEKMGISADFYAQNIVYHNGGVNDFYLVEYYVVRSETADIVSEKLIRYRDELYSDDDDFEKIKSTLIEELHENKGEFIGLGEQFSSAIYLPDSPTVRHPWNNAESIVDLSLDKATDIFHQCNTDSVLLKLSFDHYEIGKLPTIERNLLRKQGTTIKLTHPWQSPGCVDSSHIITLPKNTDFLVAMLFRRSLTDFRFGLLFNEVRNKRGLVYDISIEPDYNNNSAEIYFTTNEENADETTKCVKESLDKYDEFVKDNIDYIKGRLKLDFELDWGNIQSTSLMIIDQVISGGYIETPSSWIKRMGAITINDLSEYNRSFLNSLKNDAITIKRQHGKSLTVRVNSR